MVEAGGRAVTASRQLTAFPTDRFIGLRDVEPADGESRAFELALLPASLDDVVVNKTDTEIAISFEKVEWDCHYVRKSAATKEEWAKSQDDKRREALRGGRTVEP